MRAVGLSTNTVPAASARELVARWERGLLDVVDLRLGRQQEWEHGFAKLIECGLPISFVAADTITPLAGTSGALPLRVPLSRQAWAMQREELVQAWRNARTGAVHGVSELVVETHWNEPGSIPNFIDMCEQLQSRVVLDNLGLHRMGLRDVDELSPLNGRVLAVQVKGFGGRPERHLPLEALGGVPARTTWAVIERTPDVPVLVESKAGTADADVAVIRSRVRIMENR